MNKEQLQRQLEEGWSKTVEESQFNDNIILQLTVAPYSRKYLCATVTCQLPPCLDGHKYSIDEDFFGITPIASPPNASAE